MIEYGVFLLGLAIGALMGLLMLSFLYAAILLWRARKLKGWAIRYKDAYVVSFKAGFIGLVFGFAAVLTVAFSGGTSEYLLKYVGVLFGVVAWWFAHSSALLKLAGTSTPLTINDARAISASVFGYFILAMSGVSIVVFLVVMLITAVVGT